MKTFAIWSLESIENAWKIFGIPFHIKCVNNEYRMRNNFTLNIIIRKVKLEMSRWQLKWRYHFWIRAFFNKLTDRAKVFKR